MNPICNSCGNYQDDLNMGISGKVLCDKCIGEEDKTHMRRVNEVSMYLFKNHVSNVTKTFVLPATVKLGKMELAPDRVDVTVVFDHSVWHGYTEAKVFPTIITLKRTKQREIL